MVSPNRRDDSRKCGRAARMMPGHEEATVSPKWRGARRECRRAVCMHGGLTKRQIQMRGCVALVDMNQYCAFPSQASSHQALSHLVKMTMAS